MLIVVLYHCMLFWSGTWFVGEPVYSSTLLAVLSRWMNSFHIYGFALVSGYLFYFSKCEQGKYPKFLPFAANKARRLLIPYLFVSIVWVIPISHLFYNDDLWDVVGKYMLGSAPSQLWFLLMLFGVFMFFYPLTEFFRKHDALGGVIVILFYGFGLIGQAMLSNVFQIFRACTYLPLFWLGFKIRQHGSQGLKKIPTFVWLVVDILLFALIQYLATHDGIIFSLLRSGFNFVLHIVGALMAFVILQKIANCINWRQSKLFCLMGKYSMPIYLFHQQIIYLLLYWLNGVINPYFHTAVNFVGAMAVSLLISTLMMKYKWTRTLVGEK